MFGLSKEEKLFKEKVRSWLEGKMCNFLYEDGGCALTGYGLHGVQKRCCFQKCVFMRKPEGYSVHRNGD